MMRVLFPGLTFMCEREVEETLVTKCRFAWNGFLCERDISCHIQSCPNS